MNETYRWDATSSFTHSIEGGGIWRYYCQCLRHCSLQTPFGSPVPDKGSETFRQEHTIGDFHVAGLCEKLGVGSFSKPQGTGESSPLPETERWTDTEGNFCLLPNFAEAEKKPVGSLKIISHSKPDLCKWWLFLKCTKLMMYYLVSSTVQTVRNLPFPTKV